MPDVPHAARGRHARAADLAAQSRVLADQARERSASAGAGSVPAVSGVVEHNGNQYEILFFASEAEGDPFDVLRAVAPSATVASPPLLARNRRFRIGDQDHPRFHRPVDALDEEEQVEELQRRERETRPASEGVEVGGPLGALVHELVQPGDLSTFLARHEVARRSATAENSRPVARSHARAHAACGRAAAGRDRAA